MAGARGPPTTSTHPRSPGVIQSAAKSIASEGSVFTEADATRAARLVKQLKAVTKIRALRADLDAVSAHIEKSSGRKMQQVIESLLRRKPVVGHGPGKPTKAAAKKK